MLASLIHGLALAFQWLRDATTENSQALHGRLPEWAAAPHRGLSSVLVSEGALFLRIALLAGENLRGGDG